jgi:hypothetical protein
LGASFFLFLLASFHALSSSSFFYSASDIAGPPKISTSSLGADGVGSDGVGAEGVGSDGVGADGVGLDGVGSTLGSGFEMTGYSSTFFSSFGIDSILTAISAFSFSFLSLSSISDI